jgi:mannosyl-3-phosphoglycerate phosphatase
VTVPSAASRGPQREKHSRPAGADAPAFRIVRRPDREWGARPLLLVTDLDGSLLDETYGFAPARPALAALAAARAGLVLASSKTRAEMEPLAARLGLRTPLIVENGGAILMPREDGGWEAIARGVAHAQLRRALEEIALEAGVAVRGFSSLGPEAVAGLTGLDPAAARLALAREHDEPFVIADERRTPALVAAAQRRGLRVTRGGRFFHLTGDTDKGRAFRQLLALIARPRETVGLGDAPNDLPLLEAVDRPIVIPRADGTVEPELAAALPSAELAPAPGPVGWNAAVMTLLGGGRLATVSGGDAA